MGSFEEDRLIQIVALLQKKQELTLSYLAEKTDSSTRTIRNDLRALEKMLAGVAILESHQGLLHLYITDGEAFEKIMKERQSSLGYFNSPQARMGYIFQKLMRSTTACFADDLAEDMNIGRTTFIGDLKKLRELMAPYQLEVEGKTSQGLRLRGEELSIRIFILQNLFDVLYQDYPIDAGIDKRLEHFSRRMGFNAAAQGKLSQYVTVMLDRFLNGYKIEVLEPKYMELIKTDAYNAASAFAGTIEAELKIAVPQKERIFLTLPVAGRRIADDFGEQEFLIVPERTKDILGKINERIQWELNIGYELSKLDEEFSHHIAYMINRLLYGLRIKNPIADEIKRKYPLAYKMALIAASVVAQEYGVSVPEDEIGYLATYFSVFIVEQDIQGQRTCRVAVVCGTGRVTARLMAAQLKRILKDATEFVIFADNKTTPQLLDSFDIIFTTVKLPFQTQRPVIHTTEIFDESKLISHIQRARFLHKLQISLQPGYESIIACMLSKDHFFHLDQKKSFLENVFFMVDSLCVRGEVEEGFRERIKEREEMTSTVFDRFIAFPHAVHHASDKVVMALGVVSEGLSERGRQVKLIFLMAVPDSEESDDTLLVRIYDELLTLARHGELVEEMAACQNYEQLVRFFIKISGIFS